MESIGPVLPQLVLLLKKKMWPICMLLHDHCGWWPTRLWCSLHSALWFL